MDTALKVLFVAIITAAILFITVVINVGVGMLIGWVVEMLFPTVMAALVALTGTTATGAQLGGVLGLLSGFLRTVTAEHE